MFGRSVILPKNGQGLISPQSVTTIFDLPEVIDHMPGHAPERVAGVPSSSNQRLAARWLGEHGYDLAPHGCEGSLVVHVEGFVSHPDLASIRSFGFDDVVPYLVAVSTATTRPFA